MRGQLQEHGSIVGKKSPPPLSPATIKSIIFHCRVMGPPYGQLHKLFRLCLTGPISPCKPCESSLSLMTGCEGAQSCDGNQSSNSCIITPTGLHSQCAADITLFIEKTSFLLPYSVTLLLNKSSHSPHVSVCIRTLLLGTLSTQPNITLC